MSTKKERKKLQKHSSYSISEVFDYIDASPIDGQRVNFHGHKMYMRSTKLLNFRINGIVCKDCGRRGAYFVKERFAEDAYHLNLYGFNKRGDAMLFNRDHIKPKCKGGENDLYNAQTMCVECNSRKDNKWDLPVKLLYYYRRFLSIFKKDLRLNSFGG